MSKHTEIIEKLDSIIKRLDALEEKPQVPTSVPAYPSPMCTCGMTAVCQLRQPARLQQGMSIPY